MKLYEIATKTITNDDGTTNHIFNRNQSMSLYSHGIKNIKIRPRQEEILLFKRYGLAMPPSTIPVYYAYKMVKKPGGVDTAHPANIEALSKLDAIKQRGSQRMSPDEIEAFTRAGMQRITKAPEGDRDMWDFPPGYKTNAGPNKGVAGSPGVLAGTQFKEIGIKLRNIISGKGESHVLVTLSSSSTVVKTFADVIASELGGKVPIIHGAFLKNNWPRLSGYYWSSASKMYVPRADDAGDVSRSESPHNRKRAIELKIASRQAELDDLLSKDNPTKGQSTRLDALDANIEDLQSRLATQKFQIKNAQSRVRNDRAAGFYNFQIAVKDIASQLNNQNIILIDDNVVNGDTLADCVLALYKMNIHPKSIMGIVPHLLV